LRTVSLIEHILVIAIVIGMVNVMKSLGKLTAELRHLPHDIRPDISV
jgi:hypothetical protein